jgi:hypothetical protein
MAVQEYLKGALKKAGAEITILREARITMEDVFITWLNHRASCMKRDNSVEFIS